MIKKIGQRFIYLIKNAERQKIINILIGISGIYFFYFINAYLHELMTKQQYLNDITGAKEKFNYPISFIIYPSLFSWIMGWAINFTNPQVHPIPQLKAAKAASMTVLSQIFVNIAIYVIDYPTAMMFKSCTILSVLLVAFFCSKIKSRHLKIGPKKFITGGIITLGIFMYTIFRCAQKNKKQQTNQQADIFTVGYFAGIGLLILSLFADGFLPDFQAQIKQKYNPRPLQMYQIINKWIIIYCLVIQIFNGFQIYDMTLFLFTHKQAGIQMILKSATGAIGQMFVYKLIKDFKQHIVPFVITTRKIISISFSIFIFGHCVTFLQIIAVILVFSTVFIEFLIEVGSDEQVAKSFSQQKSIIKQNVGGITSKQMTDQIEVQMQGQVQTQIQSKIDND